MAAASSATDDILVDGLRAGRGEAFAAIYARYHVSIYNLCARLVSDREEAKDLTHDVFVKAFSRLPSQQGELKLRPWLYRVATNACHDHLRRRAKVAPEGGGELEELAAPFDVFEQSRTAALVEQTLARLNDRYRAALVLKDLHGLPPEELAAVLDVPRSTADVVVHRARRAFQRSFAALSERSGAAAGCGFARQVAQNAVGRAISREERRAIARHMKACPECRTSLNVAGVAVTGLGLVLAPLPVPATLQAMPPLSLPHAPVPGPHATAPGAHATPAPPHGGGLTFHAPPGHGGASGGLASKLASALTSKAAITVAAAALAIGGGAVGMRAITHHGRGSPTAGTSPPGAPAAAASASASGVAWRPADRGSWSYARWVGHGSPMGAHDEHWGRRGSETRDHSAGSYGTRTGSYDGATGTRQQDRTAWSSSSELDQTGCTSAPAGHTRSFGSDSDVSPRTTTSGGSGSEQGHLAGSER